MDTSLPSVDERDEALQKRMHEKTIESGLIQGVTQIGFEKALDELSESSIPKTENDAEQEKGEDARITKTKQLTRTMKNIELGLNSLDAEFHRTNVGFASYLPGPHKIVVTCQNPKVFTVMRSYIFSWCGQTDAEECVCLAAISPLFSLVDSEEAKIEAAFTKQAKVKTQNQGAAAVVSPTATPTPQRRHRRNTATEPLGPLPPNPPVSVDDIVVSVSEGITDNTTDPSTTITENHE